MIWNLLATVLTEPTEPPLRPPGSSTDPVVAVAGSVNGINTPTRGRASVTNLLAATNGCSGENRRRTAG